MRTRGRQLAIVAAVAGLALTACGPESDVSPVDSDAAWTTSASPVATGGLVWATGSTVHLGDGSTIDTQDPVAAYVVAGDGVYFVRDEKPADDFDYNGASTGDLSFANARGQVSDTGLTILIGSLSSSPDGRHLALLDVTSGDEDDHGTPQAVVRVFDLERGQEEVSSTDGMGDPDSDDLAAAYADTDIAIPLVTNETAYVRGLGETRAYDLGDGSSKQLADGEPVPAPDLGSASSPDASWTIVDRALADRLRPTSGAAVIPRTGSPRWNLLWWADPTTVVGVAIAGPGGPDKVGRSDTLSLMSCVVPAGTCTVHDDTSGVRITFPRGRTEDHGITLQDGSQP